MQHAPTPLQTLCQQYAVPYKAGKPHKSAAALMQAISTPGVQVALLELTETRANVRVDAQGYMADTAPGLPLEELGAFIAQALAQHARVRAIVDADEVEMHGWPEVRKTPAERRAHTMKMQRMSAYIEEARRAA